MYEYVSCGERPGNVLGQRVWHVSERSDLRSFADQTLDVILIKLRGLIQFVGRYSYCPVHDREKVGEQPRRCFLQSDARRGFRVLVHISRQPAIERIQESGCRSLNGHVHVRQNPDRFAFGLPDHVCHVI